MSELIVKMSAAPFRRITFASSAACFPTTNRSSFSFLSWRQRLCTAARVREEVISKQGLRITAFLDTVPALAICSSSRDEWFVSLMEMEKMWNGEEAQKE